MELAHSAARARRKPWLALDVESANGTALRVYRRLGYTEAARCGWFVGPTPPPAPLSGPVALELRSAGKETVAWVNQNTPAGIREPLPPNGRTLTHVEMFARPSRSRPKTWKLASDGRVQAIVRGHYSPPTRTGFVLPIGADPSLPEGKLASIVAPAIDWYRSLGATRIVLAVPEPVGGWSAATTTLGLPLAVSTTLMVRPSLPSSSSRSSG